MQDLRAIPESNDRVNARTRVNRTAVITRIQFGEGPKSLAFGPPMAREIVFLYRHEAAIMSRPRFRAGKERSGPPILFLVLLYNRC